MSRAGARATRVDAPPQPSEPTALGLIRQFPDAALKLVAYEVTEFDGGTLDLVRRMVTVLSQAGGVGLAANQVGALQRIIAVRPNEGSPVLVLMNPRITARSEETSADVEGCLSIPRVILPVDRAVWIDVEAFAVRPLRKKSSAMEVEEVKLGVSGLEARVVQHEVDHLDGLTIFDRVPRMIRWRAMRAYGRGEGFEAEVKQDAA